MKIDSLSLPHPVLGLGDDILGEYTTDMSVTMGKKEIVIGITSHINNRTVEELLSAGKAMFCADINCRKTIFRKSYLSKDAHQEIKIGTDLLRDKVSLNFYVVATEDIAKYSPEGHNSDYNGRLFSIRSGEVIGYGGFSEFIASKKWDNQRGVSSFLVIRPGDSDTGPYTVDLSSEKIIVILNKKDYALFGGASESGFDEFFLTSIVLPVLIYALNQMLENKTLYEDFRWYQSLEFRIKNEKELAKLEFESVNIPELAQLLLENPLSRTLTKINSLIDTSFEVE